MEKDPSSGPLPTTFFSEEGCKQINTCLGTASLQTRVRMDFWIKHTFRIKLDFPPSNFLQIFGKLAFSIDHLKIRILGWGGWRKWEILVIKVYISNPSLPGVHLMLPGQIFHHKLVAHIPPVTPEVVHLLSTAALYYLCTRASGEREVSPTGLSKELQLPRLQPPSPPASSSSEPRLGY